MIGIKEVHSLALATNAMTIFPSISEDLVDLGTVLALFRWRGSRGESDFKAHWQR